MTWHGASPYSFSPKNEVSTSVLPITDSPRPFSYVQKFFRRALAGPGQKHPYNTTAADVPTTPWAMPGLVRFTSIGKAKEIDPGIWSGELQTRCHMLAVNQRPRAVRLWDSPPDPICKPLSYFGHHCQRIWTENDFETTLNSTLY